MTKNIKYIGFYDIDNSIHKRNHSPAATSKMYYISKVLSDLQYNVDIISPSWLIKPHKFYIKKQKIILNKNLNIIFLPSLGIKIRTLRKLNVFFSELWLLGYLITNTHKNEILIVYHSLGLMRPVLIAKKIKKFKMILEVEELYQDVTKCNKLTRWLENYFINNAEKYIFPTELLHEKINNKNKNHVIIYGSYDIKEYMNKKFDDERIHIVYAGTLDLRKGAGLAINLAKYLDDNYHIHILGFGSKSQTEEIIDLIDKIDCNCKLSYDGFLTGDKYTEFLQKCSIGLCTQDSKSTFNETSFPSKILSYMSHGLRVISVNIESVKKSSIHKLITFYENDNLESIVQCIKNINLNEEYNSRIKLIELHEDFKKNILNLIVGTCNEKNNK